MAVDDYVLCNWGAFYAGIYSFLSVQYQTQLTTQQQVSQTTQQLSPTLPHAQTIITLTKNGFSPSALAIKSGATVFWINKSGKVATVDSGPHPVHTEYSPLNLGSFPDNGTLSLTFHKPSVYGYHDHLNSFNQGTITVE